MTARPARRLRVVSVRRCRSLRPNLLPAPYIVIIDIIFSMCHAVRHTPAGCCDRERLRGRRRRSSMPVPLARTAVKGTRRLPWVASSLSGKSPNLPLGHPPRDPQDTRSGTCLGERGEGSIMEHRCLPLADDEDQQRPDQPDALARAGRSSIASDFWAAGKDIRQRGASRRRAA